MTQEGQLPPPPVLWAQRREILFLTICLEDCEDRVINIEPEMIYFKGVGGTEKKMHELTINLYGEIDPNRTVQSVGGRIIELVCTKKQDGPYWPRLTKEKTKAHWLKSDFNKWKDEDDSDDDDGGIQGSGNNLENMMRQMGGLEGSRDHTPNYEYQAGFGDEGGDTDSDDDDLPDLFY